MFAREIMLGNRTVGIGHPPMVVAEMSGNHNQSLDRALQIIEAAARAGADALKIQTYTASTLTLDLREGDFFIKDAQSPWGGRALFDLYEEAHTPWEWHEPIFKKCRELGLICFSTPFDETAVDFLEDLGAPAYKIASFENTHYPLLRKVAQTGKPIFVSTGMLELSELAETVNFLAAAGTRELILLRCTSAYPALPEDARLASIPFLRDTFGVLTGLSDHTRGIGVPLAAVALGACLIEKHFTLARAEGGVDSAFSLEPDELRDLVREALVAYKAVGKPFFGTSKNEEGSRIFRRSLYVARDINKGETFTPSNLRIIRPGFGLPPKYHEVLLGKKATRDLKKGTALTWDMLLEDGEKNGGGRPGPGGTQ